MAQIERQQLVLNILENLRDLAGLKKLFWEELNYERENKPIEQEVALDRELSGKVFENLLATYNPETGATARKQTGSFYTPREIVNYMVDEALIACLKTKVEQTILSAFSVAETAQTILPASSVAETAQTGLAAAPTFKPYNPEAETHRTHRRLPHWTQEDRIYFVTFRLADSLPQEKLKQWAEEREIWLKFHPEPWSDKDWEEYDDRFGKKLEEWLDAGFGACHLSKPEVRAIVEECLNHFDGQRYDLGGYVVMPNHVHMLIRPREGFELSKIMQGIKGVSSRRVRQTILSASSSDGKGQTGLPASPHFWMDESFDHIVRSQTQFRKFQRYIAENPDKAGLKPEMFALSVKQTILSAETSDADNPVRTMGEVEKQTRLSASHWNMGVRPLPNLETQFVAANTLIGVNRPGQQLLRNRDIDAKEAELRDVRRRHFLARTPKQKAKCRDDDARLRAEIAELLKSDGWDTATAWKLATWNPYDQNASADFFDPEWMFGITSGFDVVTGNPPYGFRKIHGDEAKAYFKQHYAASQGSLEHYFLFYEAALRLLGKAGVLAFIAPVTWLTIPSAKSLRRFVLEKYSISEICWLSEQAFESASVNTLISLITDSAASITNVKIYDLLTEFPNEPKKHRGIPQKQFVDAGHYISIFSGAEDNSILEKIRRVSKPLTEFARPCSGYNPYEVGGGEAPGGGPHTVDTVREKPYHFKSKRGSQWKPEIIGRNLRRYCVHVTGDRWVKYGPWLSAARDPENFQGKRILVQEITGGKDMRLVAAYHEGELYHSRDVISIKLEKPKPEPLYLLAVINSWLLSWYHQKCNPKAQKGLFPKVLVSDLKKLPIFPASDSQQGAIVKFARRISDAKQQNPDADTSVLEREIDQQVYALYGLTPEEIKIVEASAK